MASPAGRAWCCHQVAVRIWIRLRERNLRKRPRLPLPPVKALSWLNNLLEIWNRPVWEEKACGQSLEPCQFFHSVNVWSIMLGSESFGRSRAKPYPSASDLGTRLLLPIPVFQLLASISSPAVPLHLITQNFVAHALHCLLSRACPLTLSSAWCVPLYPSAFLTSLFLWAFLEETSSPTEFINSSPCSYLTFVLCDCSYILLKLFFTSLFFCCILWAF